MLTLVCFLFACNLPHVYQVWIFDQPDGSGRLLRSRSSHSAPPTKVRFYGSRGVDILSAGTHMACGKMQNRCMQVKNNMVK